ncbi:nicotinamidase/pyrazinamidase [bacterium BMS3Bbin06]|nr:nicotinamidase/pyrazinamidase [bacterium BMS3Abin08]GBE33705.1 nicotinamidase/pyrazinamidase [bacterium BMS3Bbin06]HDY70378.1 hydrolase [Nitrospirota bacterium]
MKQGIERFLIGKEDAVLVIIDIQERLARVMEERQRVIENCLHLIDLAELHGIPVIVTEQYPKGLGSTVDEIRSALKENRPLEKITFSCCDDRSFMDSLGSLKRGRIVLTGMETHVCVLQTCLGLLKEGYSVHVVSDAVTSRKAEDSNTGIEFMRDAGAVITCAETVLFQVLKVAGTEEFRAISRRIR